jgi:hypothetical protein
LISFRIQRDKANLFDKMMIKISIAREKEHVLYHDGHGKDANVTYTFDDPTLHRMHFLFKATISRLCMFSFYQIHPTSINKTDGGPSSEDGVTNKVSVTTRSMSVHHRSHLSLRVKLLCKLHPKVPPQGIISSFLVFLLHWASYQSNQLLHVIDYIWYGINQLCKLPRETFLMLQIETSLALPREHIMQ